MNLSSLNLDIRNAKTLRINMFIAPANFKNIANVISYKDGVLITNTKFTTYTTSSYGTFIDYQIEGDILKAVTFDLNSFFGQGVTENIVLTLGNGIGADFIPFINIGQFKLRDYFYSTTPQGDKFTINEECLFNDELAFNLISTFKHTLPAPSSFCIIATEVSGTITTSATTSLFSSVLELVPAATPTAIYSLNSVAVTPSTSYYYSFTKGVNTATVVNDRILLPLARNISNIGYTISLQWLNGGAGDSMTTPKAHGFLAQPNGLFY